MANFSAQDRMGTSFATVGARRYLRKKNSRDRRKMPGTTCKTGKLVQKNKETHTEILEHDGGSGGAELIGGRVGWKSGTHSRRTLFCIVVERCRQDNESARDGRRVLSDRNSAHGLVPRKALGHKLVGGLR